MAVSIRARHQCRAMPTPPQTHSSPRLFQSAPGINAGRCFCILRFPSSQPGFNPRPASMPGDAAGAHQYDLEFTVSIRARHQCRAMPKIHQIGPAVLLFQSAPGINAGRCSHPPHPNNHHTCFNPRPASMPGDASRPPGPSTSTWSFNPRPASMPGDALLPPKATSPPRSFNPRPASMPGDAGFFRRRP